MKQVLFLLAVYALILNQARKDDKDITPRPGKPEFQFTGSNAGSSQQYHIEKYRYFDQVIYLVTSAESKRRMIVFDDGTVMEVLDEISTAGPVNAYRFTSAEPNTAYHGR